jgi:hypothetical protein
MSQLALLSGKILLSSRSSRRAFLAGAEVVVPDFTFVATATQTRTERIRSPIKESRRCSWLVSAGFRLSSFIARRSVDIYGRLVTLAELARSERPHTTKEKIRGSRL